MKRVVAMVALGIALVLAAAACGGSTSAAGHGILLVRSLDRWDYKHQIMLLRPGSAPKPLGPAGWRLFGPVWSPDGRSIAFSAETTAPENGPPLNEMFVMRADGTNVRQVSHDENNTVFTSSGEPSWSPDGRYLVYGRAFSVRPWGDIVRLDVETGHERIESSAAAARSYLNTHGVVPDPYAGDTVRSSRGELAVTQRKRIVLVAASGRVLEKLPIPRGAQLVCGVAWSPNGKQILTWTAKAFPDYPAEAVGLWVGTVSTKHWRRLPLPITKKNEYACSISWR